MRRPSSRLAPLLLLAAACSTPTSPPPATTSDTTAGTDAATAGDASPADTAADATVDGTDDLTDDATAGADTAVPSDPGAAADALPESDSTADAVPDTVPDAPVPDVSVDAGPGPDGAADSAPDAGPQPAGNVGECEPGAPGWDSCVIQAFVQCLQPVGVCAVSGGSAGPTTTWPNGSKLVCTADEDAMQFECKGYGPDGVQCVHFSAQPAADKQMAATVIAKSGIHKMAFGSDDSISVTCGDGKTEFYADDKDLCQVLEPECKGASGGGGGGGGGPVCAPLALCKPGGTCPAGMTCDPGTNVCLAPCGAQGDCPPCQTCDPADGFCKP